MEPIYVTGHRNPDTDSIVAAIAYASLRNALGDREYEPACLGRAWKQLQERKEMHAIPVANDDGTRFGMMSREDIASYNMELNNACSLDKVPLFNVLSVLEGKGINEAGEYLDTVSGEVILAIPESRGPSLFSNSNCVVICGNQPDLIRQALARNVNCLVLCRTELDPELLKIETKTCIISTPCDAYRVTRLIFQSAPIGRIYRTKDIVGVLTRYHLLCPRRKRVVLVDHNEASQPVPGLEEAEILEIIDHHRLADIQTSNPIFVRNEPVGSTNTIIAAMFQDRGLIPSEKLAGMMAAAILSDTVMFKSPTCTVRDIRTAERMARIADISLDELGKKIFSASVEGKSAKDLLYTDYKEFHIAGHDLAVAQITCVDSESMLDRKEELLTEMKAIAKKKDVSLIILMLTDVLMEGTHILYIGDDDVISQAFGVIPKDKEVFLPKIMSRKKQIIPSLSALWG